MPEYSVLCRTPTSLAPHVQQLLRDAEVRGELAVPRPADGSDVVAEQPPDVVYVVVPSEDLERARSVVDLVLPQLLEASADPSHLSDRLVRSESPGVEPLPVWRGPSESLLDEQDELLDEDDDYVPPEPPPIPIPTDRVSRFAWAAVVTGPILTLLSVLLGWGQAFIGAGIIMFFAGFVVLIARSPDRAPRDDDWDNGAVV